MDKNTEKEKQTEIHIEQINPREELNDLEKTAILQFKLDEAQEKEESELSKTMQFKILNSKSSNSNMDLPKRKTNLTDTIKLKISVAGFNPPASARKLISKEKRRKICK